MTSPVPGWYPDPHTETMIRYWDGEAWTSHTAPLASGDAPPAVSEPPLKPDQPTAGSESSTSPDVTAPQPVSPAAPSVSGPVPTDTVPKATSEEPASSDRSVWATPGPGAQPSAWQDERPQITTDDGEVVAPPFRRIAAYMVDFLIVTIPAVIVMPLLAPEWWHTVRNTMDTVGTVHTHPQVLQFVSATWLLVGVVHYFYDWVLTTKTGSTPGRRLFGLWVRLASERTNPGWTVSGQRSLLKLLHALTQPIIGVQFFTKVWLLLDAARMISNSRHEAWHDRLTGTVVVRRTKDSSQPDALKAP